MSATHLSAGWDVQSELNDFEKLVSQAIPFGHLRTGSSSRRPTRCPECQSIIYSRRHKLCSVCSQPLPAHLLFGETESQRIEQLLRTERLRHRQWMEKQSVV